MSIPSGANASVADARCLSAGAGAGDDVSLIARAVVAGCIRAGVEPLTAFDPASKAGVRTRSGTYARILAGQALRARGFIPSRLTGPLKLKPADLSPTGATRRGITTEDVAAVLAGLDDPRTVTPRPAVVRTRGSAKPRLRKGQTRADRVSRGRGG